MSRPNREVVTVILAGGQARGLSSLTQKRTVAAVPFGGKYRIIDFTLSNCVNSGLYNLLVLTQYRPLSLHEHIGNGKPWDLDRLHGGVRMVSPYIGRQQDKAAGGWDRGTADAVYQNLNELVEQDADNVLVLGGDHVYKMDYRPMLEFHLENEADVTVGVIRIPIEQASRFGIVTTDTTGRITGFEEKPKNPKNNLVSMGIYFFNREVLIDELIADADDHNSQHDFGRNVIPRMLQEDLRVFAYNFEGYWRDVGTVQAYWEAHMELLDNPKELDIYDRDWVIYTRSEERPPAVLYSNAKVERSLISHGCQIKGQVSHSILAPGVVVEEGAIVRDSVIMVDTVIGKGAVVDRAVIDKEVTVGANSQIGAGEAGTPNKREPEWLSSGVTIIGKRATLPEGMKIGRNVRISSDAKPQHFPNKEIATGESVEVESSALAR